MKPRWILFWLPLTALLIWGCTAKKKSKHPKDEKILPKPTVAPATSTDAESLTERMKNSTLGRLLIDKGVDILGWNQILPATTEQWVRLLSSDSGKVSGLVIPFSLAPQFTTLETPRIVLTAPEGSAVRARIFLAFIEHEGETLVEFISWNPVRHAFDFGTIESKGKQRRASFADEPTCFACHRTRSPIFPNETWDNSVVNRSILAAFVEKQVALAPSEFALLHTKMSEMLQRDQAARAQRPPATDDFIDHLMQADETFRQASYRGFPFVDADSSQAFDFNQAIFEAHTLVVANDWLQTLPNQLHAEQIANDRSLHLIDLYPEHHRSLATLGTSPYLLNFNIVAGEVNSFHSLDAVIPSKNHIQAVIDYNEAAKKSKAQLLPNEYRPTSAGAFEEQLADWQDFLSEEVLLRAFGKDDPIYKPVVTTDETQGENPVAHDQLCSSCHDGSTGSPAPNYRGWNPLREADWTPLLVQTSGPGRELLCDTLLRIRSPTAPMPPQNSRQGQLFSTYRASTILTLQTLAERHQITCRDTE